MRKLLSFISDGKENKLIYFRGIRKQTPEGRPNVRYFILNEINVSFICGGVFSTEFK